MGGKSLTTELFRFEPWRQGVDADSVQEVHVIGEFNDWGLDPQALASYALTRDQASRWSGLLSVPRGHGFYKFLINQTISLPMLGHQSYSTVSTPSWARRATWYQIFVDRFYRGAGACTDGVTPWDGRPDYYNHFGGNLRGIEEMIPYLTRLFGTLEN